MWTITTKILELLSMRYQVGLLHGSEHISMLLYSLVRREQPEVVVELGTGMGVSSVWIAAALKENGHGMLYTYDNGSHYEQADVKEFLHSLSGPIAELSTLSSHASYSDFMNKVFDLCDVSDRIRFTQRKLELPNTNFVRIDTGTHTVDLLFSDYMHSVVMVERIIASFLPMMSGTSSIFIDSASSHIPSYMALERITSMLNDQKLPATMSAMLSPDDLDRAARMMRTSTFKLMHLMEKLARPQNSTAWLRIEPADMVPPVTTFFH